MKITASSDWRDGLAYDIPVLVADVMPGDPTRCFVCGPVSEPRERTELWAVKHRHPNNHAGVVRFYCLEHRPQPPRVTEPAAGPSRPARAPRSSSAARRTPRPASAPERVAAVCPTCFIEIPATGVCGMCGERVG
ncbi:MAG: glucose-6-phosphate dehydrogenase [Microbacterium sp.]|uniref:glucose-6-phosphate dehydrogenase n=1 Tax=Microbacterium sp. TaxID=51671 RepID=UPI000DB00F0F|nr:glucose-6-phosphate dehydrogenase [Microbacterium sp.]PZU41072.1 MAG: glucose-6-phosphate dehydrogenase [Microbacterium sp.]